MNAQKLKWWNERTGGKDTRGLGDVIERLVKPIAKALKLPCLGPDDNLKPESQCAKRRDTLNRLTQSKLTRTVK